MTWIFRGMTAIGAFFLVQTYNEILAMRADVNQALLNQAVLRVEMDANKSVIADHTRQIRFLQRIEP